MMISEPMTFFTDLVLAVEGLVIGHLLFWRFSKKFDKEYYKLWSMSFLFLGVGSLFGGLYHGLSLNEATYPFIKNFWPISVFSIGLDSYYMLLSVVCEFFYSYKKMLYPLAFLKLGFFIFFAVTSGLKFFVVICDYAPVLILLLIMNFYRYLKTKHQSYLQMVIGIIISLLGSFAQMLRLGISDSFNHNDVYHLIEMLALFVMYRALAARRYQKKN